jgi:hypothetical protein
MEIEHSEGKTIFSGTVRDQAQLHGLIERVEELGLDLLSVQQVDTSQPGSARERDEA